MQDAAVASVKRAPHSRDAVGHGVDVDRPKNPRVRVGRGKKCTRDEPERDEENAHDGVKALARFHRPGDEKAETGEAKSDKKKGEQANQNPRERKVQTDEGREEEKNQTLQKRERGAAENLAANDAAGRDRRDQNRFEKTFAPIFDDRDGREDGGKEHDENQRVPIKVFEVIHSVRRGADMKRRANPGADNEPENERRRKRADDAIALGVEAHDLRCQSVAVGKRKKPERFPPVLTTVAVMAVVQLQGDISIHRLRRFSQMKRDENLNDRAMYVWPRRIEDRTTADGLAESLTEMTQAGVADFGRGFGHVVAAAAEKFRGALHPRVAQKLRNRQANFPRKNPAQIIRAAANFLSEDFQ